MNVLTLYSNIHAIYDLNNVGQNSYIALCCYALTEYTTRGTVNHMSQLGATAPRATCE